MARAEFNPRKLAKDLSDFILKGKHAKNKKFIPVRSGADNDNADIFTYLSWGTSALDAATGGGLACGRMTMVYGDPSSGKSLLAESAILAAQERGGIGCVIDSEATFNKARFASKGGDINAVMFIEARCIEDGFEIMEKLVKWLTGPDCDIDLTGPIVIVWDTIATNQTRNMVKGNEYAAGMMEAPRVINKGMRDITETIASSNVALLILNQVYGDQIPPGGKGLQFFASQMIYLEKVGECWSYRTGKPGTLLKARIKKTKTSPPVFKDIFFACDEQGVDDAMSIYFNCVKRGKGKKEVDPGIFGSKGTWTTYEMSDEKTTYSWQNEEGFYDKVEADPELLEELAARMWELFPPGEPASVEADDEFVAVFKDDNKWVKEGVRYAHCLISDHMCPVPTWKACRAGYWTECWQDLDDVKTLERVYHLPPEEVEEVEDEEVEEEEE